MELVPKGVDPKDIDMKRYLELDDMEQDDLFEECLRYEVTLKQAAARIKELERCCVMGGDGKPIAVGDKVKSTQTDEDGSYVEKIEQYDGGTVVSGSHQIKLHGWSCSAKELTRVNPEDVPGGAE